MLSRNIKKILLFSLWICLFLTTIGFNSSTYTIIEENGKVRIRLFREEVSSYVPINNEKFQVVLQPEPRFSTPQILIPDSGAILNGFQILRRLIFSKQIEDELVLYQERGTARDYIHFNPFRTGITLGTNSHNFRVAISIPERSIEINEGPGKSRYAPIKPSLVKLILFPFLSAISPRS